MIEAYLGGEAMSEPSKAANGEGAVAPFADHVAIAPFAHSPIRGAHHDQPLLSVRNLETYYGPITAIRGVSFDVTEGQIVTILGANGAGKTTVLKSVCGAMEPQKGTVAFAGRSIVGREPDWVARHGIAHVPEGREIFPFMTVKGNLMMGAYARRDRPTSSATSRSSTAISRSCASAQALAGGLPVGRPAADAGDRPRR